ncbi:uncharacterized protein COLE_02880 [Cutaneotrichosporon oleaginosum]|uniref:uncharacterized protein n=1 Tax=Cutaneotrichosporon oleaginosum TaxID=879819 RepID=UPI00132B68F8|nr:hypothetical protein COLE_02880 [Cutaneotrichosporon oleaginosum]
MIQVARPCPAGGAARASELGSGRGGARARRGGGGVDRVETRKTEDSRGDKGRNRSFQVLLGRGSRIDCTCRSAVRELGDEGEGAVPCAVWAQGRRERAIG